MSVTVKEKVVLWLVATTCLSFLITLGSAFYYINAKQTQKTFEKGIEFAFAVDSTIPKVNQGIKDAKATVKKAGEISKEVTKIQKSKFVVKTDLNLDKNIPILINGMQTTINSLNPVIDKIDKAYGTRITQTESLLDENKEELPSLLERGITLINSPKTKETLNSPEVQDIIETGEELIDSPEVQEVLDSPKTEKTIKENKLSEKIANLLSNNAKNKVLQENIDTLKLEDIIAQLEKQKTEKNNDSDNSIAYIETEEGLFFDNTNENVEVYNDENQKIEDCSTGINFLSKKEIENTETLTFASGNEIFNLVLNN